jgi:polar amino acid transport system substrate-binding protein
MTTLPRRALLRATVAAPLASLASPALAEAPKTVTPGGLTLAYRADDKPVSFIADGKPAGFQIDFTSAIAAKLGFKPEFVATDFASMVPAVAAGRYDSAAFAVLVTPQRQGIVDFTTPVTFNEARLVSLRKTPLARVQDAGGKTVAITRGSALIPVMEHLAPSVTVREFPNIAASLNALRAGQVAGLFTGLATADSLVAAHDDLASSQIVTSGEGAYPVARANTALLGAMNTAIAALMRDGTYIKLFAQWFPQDVRIPQALYDAYPGMPRQAPLAG